MNIDVIKKMCIGLGSVKKFNVNPEVFGNMELEIETPNGKTFLIVSDRGIFSCYLKKNLLFGNRLIPINKIVDGKEKNMFSSLEAAIACLKKLF